MVEIAIALFLVAVAFLPIYSLFSYGRQGTENNVFEVTASNYASDMINFIRDLKPEQIRKAPSFSGQTEITLNDDADAEAFFKTISLVPPSKVLEPYSRKVSISDKWHKNWLEKIWDKILDLFERRQQIDSMLARVEVTFPKPDRSKGLDKVVLYSIIMD